MPGIVECMTMANASMVAAANLFSCSSCISVYGATWQPTSLQPLKPTHPTTTYPNDDIHMNNAAGFMVIYTMGRHGNIYACKLTHAMNRKVTLLYKSEYLIRI